MTKVKMCVDCRWCYAVGGDGVWKDINHHACEKNQPFIDEPEDENTCHDFEKRIRTRGE